MSMAMRDAFGKKLESLGAVHPELVVLDADVSSSTKSIYFKQTYPDRFFNCGVAEGNMVGVAAGLASCGYHPVVNAFSIFLALKGTDQIRNDLCYNGLPVILAGAYGGLSDSFDGASHQSITDIAIMRSMPGMEVIVPGDSLQAEQALEYALTRSSPVYIRLNRNEMPELPAAGNFSSGKVIVCREGKDVTIAANGITATFANEAARALEQQGISAEVLSVPFVKPLDAAGLEKSVRRTGALVTVEEHTLCGGFAGAVCEAFMKNHVQCRFKAIGIEDTFTETGAYIPLLEKYGISSKNIEKQIITLLGKQPS